MLSLASDRRPDSWRSTSAEVVNPALLLSAVAGPVWLLAVAVGFSCAGGIWFALAKPSPFSTLVWMCEKAVVIDSSLVNIWFMKSVSVSS